MLIEIASFYECVFTLVAFKRPLLTVDEQVLLQPTDFSAFVFAQIAAEWFPSSMNEEVPL